MSDQLPAMSEQQVDSAPSKKRRRGLWVVTLIALFAVVAIGVSWSIGKRPLATEAEDALLSATPEPAEENILAEDMRQFIWDVEHIAFEMEAKVLPKIKQALTEPNLELLSRYLSPGFRGTIPSQDWQVVASAKDWQVSRKEVDAGSTQVSALQFASRMASYRELFDPADECECGASIGLVRLGPVNKDSIYGPWGGQWRIRMWGEQDGEPLELLMSLSVDLAPLQADVETQTNFIRSATLERIERRESASQLFRDVTAKSGIQTEEMYDFWKLPSNQFKGSSGGVYLSDYDDDGNVDALVDDAFTGPILYRGLGDGSFERANEQAELPSGLPSPSGACWADLDNDGDIDLILGGGMFSNDGDGTFSLIPAEFPTFDIGVALSVADYDGDGLVDIYESHSHSPSVPQQMREGPDAKRTERPSWIDGGWGFDNVLWKNLGNWQFQDVTDRANAGDRGGAAFSSVWLHANEDRAPDLLSINEFGRNSLLINQGNGSFRNTRLDNVFGGWSMGVVAGDYDNDGLSDVFVSNMYSKAGNRVISNVDPTRYPEYLYKIIHDGTLGNKLYRSLGDGTFETVEHDPVFAQIGWTYGCSFTDYDGDGNLDLYATAGFKSEKKGKPDG